MYTSRLAVLAVLFGLSGCSVLVPGFDKKPAETPPPTTAANEQPAEEKAADWPKPCDLYNAGEELPAYDFKIAADNVYTCDWTHELGQGKTNVLGVNVWQGLSLEKAAAPPAAVRTIGTHSGKLYEENDIPGGCRLSLVAGDGHVTVHARMQEVEESCDVVRKVEPNLPS